MHHAKRPLGLWIRAIWSIAASSKGISARKLMEMQGITCKVAWQRGHRSRAMMIFQDLVLCGVVEIDEMYAGAPPRKTYGGGFAGVQSGRGPRRPLVLTVAERGGRAVVGHIKAGAAISTDGLPAYRKAAAGHMHMTVTYSWAEFVARDPVGLKIDAHPNTAEGI
jgi:hypothetical protein